MSRDEKAGSTRAPWCSFQDDEDLEGRLGVELGEAEAGEEFPRFGRAVGGKQHEVQA